MKRPSLPRIPRSLCSGPPRLKDLTGGTGDNAMAWKRPSNSPSTPHREWGWMGMDRRLWAYRLPSNRPLVPPKIFWLPCSGRLSNIVLTFARPELDSAWSGPDVIEWLRPPPVSTISQRTSSGGGGGGQL